ncbi:MAG: calcium-binding EGF-like domain-containing protein [Myxococcota bacterium]
MTTGPTSVAGAEGSGSTSASGGGMTSAETSMATGIDSTSGGEVPECSRDSAVCDPNATCDEDTGECTCNPGYEGDGRQCSVDAMLPTLRIEALCVGQGPCGSSYCLNSDFETDEAEMTGDPAVSYEVTLRFRGVFEEKEYNGGTNDGFWHEGGTPNDDEWNIYELEISDPPQSYWLNSGSSYMDHCEMVDYEQTVTVLGGSMVTVTMEERSGSCAARNRDDGGDPIVIPGIPPAPDSFNGQFLQVDVVDIVPVP